MVLKQWMQEQVDEMVRLHGMWLRGEEGGKQAVVVGVSFYETDLSNVNLSRGWFHACSFTGIDMSGVVAKEASFAHSMFLGTTMKNANLEGAVFVEDVFDGTDCTCANLRSTKFADMKIKRSDFRNAKLNYSSVYSALIHCSDFTDSDCEHLRMIGVTGNIGATSSAVELDKYTEEHSDFGEFITTE